MILIKEYEKNKKAINREIFIKILKDYKDALNEINTIQKLLLLNKELETILNEHLPKHFKVKDLTTLTKIL